MVVKVGAPTATKDALDCFRREAEILRRLSQLKPSPYIVRFYDYGEAVARRPPTRFRPGERASCRSPCSSTCTASRSSRCSSARAARFPVRRARRIAREVAKALETVHAEGIDRDLKPSNILIASEAGREVAKVTDFGLVKLADIRATATQALAGEPLLRAAGAVRARQPARGDGDRRLLVRGDCDRAAHRPRGVPRGERQPVRGAAADRDRAAAAPLGAQRRAPVGAARSPLFLFSAGAARRAARARSSPEPSLRPQALKELWDSIDPLLREAEESPGQAIVQRVASEQTRPGMADAPGAGTAAGSRSAEPTAARHARAPARARDAGERAAAPPAQRPRRDDADAGSAAGPRLQRPARVELARDSHGSAGAQVRAAVFRDSAIDARGGGAGALAWARAGDVDAGGRGDRPGDARADAHRDRRAALRGRAGAARVRARRRVLGRPALPRFRCPSMAWPPTRRARACSRLGERVSRGHAFATELTTQGFRRTFESAELPLLRAVAFVDATSAIAAATRAGS